MENKRKEFTLRNGPYYVVTKEGKVVAKFRIKATAMNFVNERRKEMFGEKLEITTSTS